MPKPLHERKAEANQNLRPARVVEGPAPRKPFAALPQDLQSELPLGLTDPSRCNSCRWAAELSLGTRAASRGQDYWLPLLARLLPILRGSFGGARWSHRRQNRRAHYISWAWARANLTSRPARLRP